MPPPWTALVPYALLGVVTFGLYGLDKRAARRGLRRVPEGRLHVLALLGGFWGAWIGRRLFRHKTRKPVFTAVIALAALLHLGCWAWVLWGRS